MSPTAWCAGEWTEPALTHRNREAVRATAWPYSTQASARRGDIGSLRRLPLDGAWQFHAAESHATKPDPATLRDVEVAAWDQIDVPGHWELQGFAMPTGHAVGTYATTFTLPEAWRDMEVFLHFAGICSAATVWVNGRDVGYWEENVGPGEFRLTPLLRTDVNRLIVQVYEESDASQFSGMGHEPLHGIHGSVYLFAVPKAHIRDVAITTGLGTNRAEMGVTTSIRNFDPNAQTLSLAIQVFAPDGTEALPEALTRTFVIDGLAQTQLNASVSLRDPLLWTAETPERYRAVITLSPEEEEAADIRAIDFGLRDVSIREGIIHLNGEPLVIRGVEYEGHSPYTGRALSHDEMDVDIALMKEANINAVRIRGSAPPPYFIERCDAVGLYVFDETNLEPRDEGARDDPEWRAAYMDAVHRMYDRDKNHPSIIAWSLGDITLSGENHRAAAGWLREHDPERQRWGGEVSATWNDFAAPVAPSLSGIDRVVKHGDAARPILLNGYGPARGNGLGNLVDYGAIIDRTPRVQGGFIGHWADSALARDTLAFVSSHDQQLIVAGSIAEVDERMALTDGFATIPPDPSLALEGAAFAVEVLIKPEAGASVWITKGSEAYELGQTDDGSIYFASGPNTRVTVPVPEAWRGAWHTLRGESTDADVSLVIDGEVVSSVPRMDMPRASGMAVYIGLDPDTGVGSHGAIAQAMLDGGEGVRVDVEFSESVSLETPWFDHRDGIGIVDPDRYPRPTYWSVKDAYAPVHVEAIDAAAGKVRVKNRFQFVNLDALTTRWSLEENGAVIDSGTIATPAIEPGGRQELWLPFTSPRPRADAVYTLTTRFSLASDTLWANAGHEVYAASFEVDLRTPAPRPSGVWGPMRLTEKEDRIRIVGTSFHMEFERTSGMLTEWIYDGRDVVALGPSPNVWRAPVDNDRIGGRAAAWRAAGLNGLRWTLESISSEALDDKRIDVHVVQRAETNSEAGFLCQHAYRIYGDGRILLQQSMEPYGELPDRPKLGVQLVLPPEYWKLEWFGLGPHETYPDRIGGALIGRYAEDAALAPMPYATPQEYGNKSAVRWAAMLDDEGFGLALKFEEPGNVSARPYATYQLEEARHAFALMPNNVITLNADFEVAGVGNGHELLDAYRISPTPTTYRMWLRPISPEDDLSAW